MLLLPIFVVDCNLICDYLINYIILDPIIKLGGHVAFCCKLQTLGEITMHLRYVSCYLFNVLEVSK